jgi:hypothetical protein
MHRLFRLHRRLSRTRPRDSTSSSSEIVVTQLPLSVPDLHVGRLTRTEFTHYVDDLRAAASDLRVLIRRAPHRTEECDLPGLATLCDAIDAGLALGAQVIYAFDGKHYRDVLLPLAADLRLVRMELDELVIPSS